MSEHDAHRPGLGSMPHEGGTAFRVWAPNADAVAVTGSFTDWSEDGHADGRRGQRALVRRRRGRPPRRRVPVRHHQRRPAPHAHRPARPRRHELVGQRRRLRPRRLRLGGRHVRLPAARRARHLRDPHRLVRRDRGRRRRPRGTRRQARLPRRARHQRHRAHAGRPSSPATTPGATTRRTRSPSRAATAAPTRSRASSRRPTGTASRSSSTSSSTTTARATSSLWQFDGWSEDGKGGIYFYNDERSSTPWGDTRPDYGREEVRAYLHDNALMWLEEFHLDGLRFDATLYVRTIDGLGTGDLPEGWDLMRSITTTIRERHPDKILIAEDLQSDPAITSADEGGGGLPRPVGRELRPPGAGAADGRRRRASAR